jgi:ubiquinone/menaquinone biosynthesis C-methylase UbiE
MDDDTRRGQLTDDSAEIYEAFFVPALFAQWPEHVLDAAGVVPGDRVLDVGCGTGVLAAAAATRVGPSGRVVGLDPNDAMLAVAAGRASTVEWRPGVAEAIPFPDDSFDRVVCQFALMFFDDRTRGLREMARVLRPGGVAAVATWADAAESPGYAAMIDLVGRVVGPAAADALRAPFALGTARVLADLVAGALADVEVARLDGTARFASIEAWVHTDIRGWTLGPMVDDACYDRLLAAAVDELALFVDPDGSVAFAAPALVASGHGA